MKDCVGKSQQKTMNNKDHKPTAQYVNPYFSAPYDEEDSLELDCIEVIRYWMIKFFVNGMFTTSRIIGYTQFMVFMILRVIITGSLCGRMFGNDPELTNCSLQMTELNSNIALLNISSKHNDLPYDVKMTCLRKAYSYLSPITLWALGLLTVFLPWLCLLPWTPMRDDQDYVICKHTNIRWPCLTIYVVRFMKACMRLILEVLCLISVPIFYAPEGIPASITCYQDAVKCDINDFREKTCFLWQFSVVNFISLLLTICELVDICVNKQVYESESGSFTTSKISSARSSTATMNTFPYYYNKKEQSDAEQGRATVQGSSYSQVAYRAEASKRRIGQTRSADPTNISKENKFRGRYPRSPECDEVIKIAAPVKPEIPKTGVYIFPHSSNSSKQEKSTSSDANGVESQLLVENDNSDIILHPTPEENGVNDINVSNASNDDA